jgi:hypothetical protein
MTLQNSKTVFSFFSSFGPAGSIVNMAEKACRRLFPEAYSLGEASLSTREDHEIKKLRQDYVN